LRKKKVRKSFERPILFLKTQKTACKSIIHPTVSSAREIDVVNGLR
jgi:hypothetical protein